MAPFVYREAPEKFDFSRFDHRGRVEVRYQHILLNTLRMIFATCVWLKGAQRNQWLIARAATKASIPAVGNQDTLREEGSES